MEMFGSIEASWKDVKSIDTAVQLVDYGIILSQKEIKYLKNALSEDDINALVRHLSVRIAERINDRLSLEIAIESLLCLALGLGSEEMFFSFYDELFMQGNAEQACWVLVQVALSSESTDLDFDDDFYSMAVILICEMGTALRRFEANFPGEYEGYHDAIDHIATYLISISNTNNVCIRLALLNYFGRYHFENLEKSKFNRVMHRFGHSMLEGLFTQLFEKKTESISLYFLMEVIPCILCADNNAQKILHNNFKFHMLKNPERFILFLSALCDNINAATQSEMIAAKRILLQHIYALFQIANEVGHKELGKDLSIAMLSINDDFLRRSLIANVSLNQKFRPFFKDLIDHVISNSNKEDTIQKINKTKNTKRGRKPSITAITETISVYRTLTEIASNFARAS